MTAKVRIFVGGATVFSSMLTQGLYAGSCALLGMIFVEVRQLGGRMKLLPTVLTLLCVAAVVMWYGYYWYYFTLNKGKDRLNCIWLPVAAATVICGSTCCTAGRFDAAAAGICVVFTLTFCYLSNLLVTKRDKLLGEENYPYHRRFTVVMPMVFVAIQSCLFSGCLMIAVQGYWYTFPTYSVIVVGYLLLWQASIQKTTETIIALNAGILVVITVFCILYFFGYYTITDTDLEKYAAYKTGIRLLTKTMALSVYCCGVISIPGIVDLAQLQHFDCKDYEDRNRALSVLIGLATVAIFITWTWIRFSVAYLIVIVFDCLLWTINVKYRRKEDSKISILSPIGCLLFTVGFLSTECLGWWDAFGVPAALPEATLAGLSLQSMATVIISAISLVLKMKVEGPKGISLRQQIWKQLTGIRVFGAYMIGLIISEPILIILYSMGGNVQRISFASMMIILAALVEVIAWVLAECFEYGRSSSP